MDYQELLTNDDPLPIPKHHKFRKSWRWPHCIEDFFRLRIEGKYSLHVCCGQSSLGDIRIDIDPNSKRTHEGDMNNIPFENETFDIVFCDWPWKLNYFQRWKPFYELIKKMQDGRNDYCQLYMDALFQICTFERDLCAFRYLFRAGQFNFSF